jgi:mevalonate kinase
MKDIAGQHKNAKILLFGEHTLMIGSEALSVPYNKFSGILRTGSELMANPTFSSSNQVLKGYHEFLKKNLCGSNYFTIDLEAFDRDISKGLYFDSNIPQGYGLGSSGALIAALFSRYRVSEEESNSSTTSRLAKLKSFFSLLEGYFHGTSSGLDPLVSFLNRAIHVQDKDHLEPVTMPWKDEKGQGAVFILDSGLIGDTQPLVAWFRSRYENQNFRKTVDHKYIPEVNRAIGSYLDGNRNDLLESVNKISEIQLHQFTEMVPSTMRSPWEEGLSKGSYALKLCGSGGGGMVLGFTGNYKEAEQKLQDLKPIIFHEL